MIFLLGLTTMGLAWLLPGHDFPWAAFHQEAVAGTGAALVVLAALVARGAGSWRVPIPAGLALAVALVPPVQWAAGLIPYGSDALLASVYLIGFGLAAIAGCRLAQDNRSFVPALFAMFGVAALAAFTIGLTQWLQLGPLQFIHALVPGDRVYANFTQPNHLAVLLGLGIVAAIWGYEARSINSGMAGLGLGALIFGLVMTQSRVGWLFVGALVILWAALRTRIGLRAQTRALVAWVLVFMTATLVLPWLTHALAGAESTSVTNRVQSGSRWLHWQTIWDAVLRSPWVGYGWNQVSSAQQAAVLDHHATFEWLGSSHNLLLDLLAWNGIPLGMAVIGVCTWWTLRMWRGCAGVDAWALMAALAILLTHSMVEYPLMYAYFLLPAGLVVGALDACVAASKAAPTRELPHIRGALAVLTAILVTVTSAIGIEYGQIDGVVRDLRFRDAGLRSTVEVPNVVLLDGPREYLLLWATKNDDGDPNADMAWLRRVSQRFATPPALLRYAVASGVRGDGHEALRTLKVLCSVSLPRHCDEARDHWARLSVRLPGLRRVQFPPTPVS